MKFKTILACAVLGLVIFNGRLNAAVESDVVGYQNIDIKPGFNMIAFNFQPLTGEGVSIQDFVADKEALVAGAGTSVADQIQVWDPVKNEFTVYFYRAKSNRFSVGPAWVKVGATTTATADVIQPGSGVWFARPKTATASTITVSGKITTESNTHEIQPGFNMISSAFPVDMPLNNGPIDWEACGAVAGAGTSVADQIQVWDPETEEFTVYFYRAKSNRFSIGPAWVKVGATTTATADTIPAGKGFWFARPATATAGTLNEASPIAE